MSASGTYTQKTMQQSIEYRQGQLVLVGHVSTNGDSRLFTPATSRSRGLPAPPLRPTAGGGSTAGPATSEGCTAAGGACSAGLSQLQQGLEVQQSSKCSKDG